VIKETKNQHPGKGEPHAMKRVISPPSKQASEGQRQMDIERHGFGEPVEGPEQPHPFENTDEHARHRPPPDEVG
jgi:hypothetical protein